MKIIFVLILLLFTASASAEVIATLENEAGGKIVLTNLSPPACEGKHAAYSTGPNNNTIWGCWYYDEMFVHVEWIGINKTRSYPIENFTGRNLSPKT